MSFDANMHLADLAVDGARFFPTAQALRDCRDYGEFPKQAVTLGALSADDGGGGMWRYVSGAAAGTYTDNLGTVLVPTGGDGSAAWLRDFDGRISVKAFGAVGDSATNDTAAFNAAIDYCHSKNGGVVVVPKGRYRIANVELKTNVSLVGVGGHSDYKFGSTGSAYTSELRSYDTGADRAMLKVSSGNTVKSVAIRYLTFFGDSGATDAITGLLTEGEFERNVIEHCSSFYVSGGAINIASGVYNTIQNCQLFSGTKTDTGSITACVHIGIGASECVIQNCEIANSPSDDSSNPDMAAIRLDGSTPFLVNVVAEGSDYGIYLTCNNGNFVNCRADINYAHGWYIAGRGNKLTNCWGHRNSAYATNTFDNFHVPSGTHHENHLVGCKSTSALSVDGFTHRYGYYDASGPPTSADPTGRTNVYLGCTDDEAGTNWFYSPSAGQSPHMPLRGWIVYNGDTTPSVSQMATVEIRDTAANSITDFDGGVEGQEITVITATGNTTFVHSSQLNLAGNADLNPGSNSAFKFVNRFGKWIQVAGG
jgi:hypothetical protein